MGGFGGGLALMDCGFVDIPTPALSQRRRTYTLIILLAGVLRTFPTSLACVYGTRSRLNLLFRALTFTEAGLRRPDARRAWGGCNRKSNGRSSGIGCGELLINLQAKRYY